MIERLVHSLQALAAPAAVQLARFPDFAVRADELALDYADAVLLAADCPQLRLERAQRRALDQLDEHLKRMGAVAGAGPWTEDAVRTSPEWEAVRKLARDALAALGAPVDLTPPGDAAPARGRTTERGRAADEAAGASVRASGGGVPPSAPSCQ